MICQKMPRLLMELLAWVLLLSSAVAQSRSDVMWNGSFEEGQAGWQPTVTDPQGVGSEVTIELSQAKAGGKSLKIRRAGPGSATIASPLASVQSGRDFLLTFWYRSEGFSETGNYAGVNLQYVLDWLDIDRKSIGTGGMGLSYAVVPRWRFMVSMLTPPPDSAFVKIRFGLLLAVSRIVEHVEVERDFAGRILKRIRKPLQVSTAASSVISGALLAPVTPLLRRGT